MKILLHICCAPCLIYPFEQLNKKGMHVQGYFYNPNIYPISEYKKRRDALVAFSAAKNIDILYPEYSSLDFLSVVKENELSPQRCAICWGLRLKRTAQVAKENNFDLFSTTLLVSPYQDQAMLKKIGMDIAKDTGIPFFYEDFRPGFRKAQDQARKEGIYRQKYCGCIYSIEEAASLP